MGAVFNASVFGIVESTNTGSIGVYAFPIATGGTITYDGDYKIHTFNSSSNFIVTNAGVNNDVSVFLVGAGCIS